MKQNPDAILHAVQQQYLDSLLQPRDRLLAEMEHYARETGQPIADPEVAQLMRLLLRLKKPRHLIEIGTNIGYSVVVMGRECGSDAVIETIEIDRAILDVARRFVGRAGIAPRVVFHEGAALEVLRRLSGPFDFAFIDCVKTEYGDYLDLLLPRLEDGAVIIFDNLLWGGKVATGDQEPSTIALRNVNSRIMNEANLLSTLIPLSDGVGISIVQSKTASRSGGRLIAQP